MTTDVPITRDKGEPQMNRHERRKAGKLAMPKVVVFGAIQVSAAHDVDDVHHKYIAPDDPRATEWFVLIDHGDDRPYEFPAVFSFESRQPYESQGV
jgi:hypothetical protein